MIYITCNPYLEKPFPMIQLDNGNGVKISVKGSSLALAQMEPLGTSLNAHGDWKGLFPEIASVIGVPQVTIEFRGCIEDYQLLKTAARSSDTPKVEIITDETKAQRNSPAERKKLLNDELFRNRAYFQCNILREKNLVETCEACKKILLEEIPPVTAVRKIKKKLDEYFLNHFEADKKFLAQEISKLKNETGLKDTPDDKLAAEIDRLLPMIEILRRLMEETSATLKRDIYSITQAAAEEISPSNFDFVAETEINGVKGNRLEESDAAILIEKFWGNILAYCRKINDKMSRAWLEETNCFYLFSTNYKPVEQLIDKIKNTLPEIVLCQEEIQLDIVTMTYDKPSYWAGNEAQQIVIRYADVGKYERDALNLAIKKICDATRQWQIRLNQVVYACKVELERYYENFRRMSDLLNMREILYELRTLTKKLTALDWEE